MEVKLGPHPGRRKVVSGDFQISIIIFKFFTSFYSSVDGHSCFRNSSQAQSKVSVPISHLPTALHPSTMASTTPSQQISTSTIVLAATGIMATGAVAYAFYFDYRRRSDPEFRRYLKKQHKKVQKSSEESAKAAERSQKARIKQVVEEANEEGFPRDPEDTEATEAYFMQEVARGETMCTDGSDPVDAALCFYKALKVYPQPRELINIYDKTVPKVCHSDFLI